jgi:hypothetical protein
MISSQRTVTLHPAPRATSLFKPSSKKKEFLYFLFQTKSPKRLSKTLKHPLKKLLSFSSKTMPK